MSFIDELKRRNVIRVAIAYVIVVWLIAQVTELALDSFAAPDWVMKTVLFLLVIGFPVALVLAWAYETTPDGVRRDTGIAGKADKPLLGVATTRQWSRTAIFGVVVALLIGVLIGAVVGRLTFDLPESSDVSRTPIQLTANPGDNAVVSGAISPDGRYLAYADDRGLLLRLIRSGETHVLALPDEFQTGNLEIDWFPDGAHLLTRLL